METQDYLKAFHELVIDGKYEDVLSAFDGILSGNGQLQELLLGRALALAGQAKKSEAVKTLDALLMIYPSNSAAEKLRKELLGEKESEPNSESESESISQNEVGYDQGVSLVNTAVELLTNGDFRKALEAINEASRCPAPLRDCQYVKGIILVKMGELNDAVSALKKEIQDFPNNENAELLLKDLMAEQSAAVSQANISVGEAAEKKYVLFYATPRFPHARYIMGPVFDYVREQGEVDATMISANGREGLEGEGFSLGPAKMNRQPDAIMLWHPWWNDDHQLGMAARYLGIPIVMLNHGAMFVKNDAQTYKKTIFPAGVGCLWGEHDRQIWRSWGNTDKLVVTGNPSYNPAEINPARIEGLPERYALALTPGQGFQRKIFDPSLDELNKIIPVVVKAHPLEPRMEELKSKFMVFTEADTLFPLLYHSELIASNTTSAFIPALYWEKPIFIHSFQDKGVYFNDFKAQYPHVFNFKSDPIWTEEMIENPVRPSKEDFNTFGCLPDGKAPERCAEAIMNCLD